MLPRSFSIISPLFPDVLPLSLTQIVNVHLSDPHRLLFRRPFLLTRGLDPVLPLRVRDIQRHVHMRDGIAKAQFFQKPTGRHVALRRVGDDSGHAFPLKERLDGPDQSGPDTLPARGHREGAEREQAGGREGGRKR